MRGKRSENKIRKQVEAVTRKRFWQKLSLKYQIENLKCRRGKSKKQIARIQALIKCE